jgi:hypothetical protein
MKDDDLIKLVLENLDVYTITVHPNKSMLEFSDYRAHMITDPEEELFRHFLIKNIADLDVLVFEHNRMVKLDYLECERLINFLNDQPTVRKYFDGAKSYSRFFQYGTVTSSNPNHFTVNDNYIIMVNNQQIIGFEEFDGYAEFKCQDGSVYSYNLIMDSKKRKWFNVDGDTILIFDTASSLF